MNAFKKILVAVAVCAAAVAPASAQFRFGPRLGMNVNELHLNHKVFDSRNRAGFNGGVTAEFMIPALNFGIDASVMYVHRVSNVAEDPEDDASRMVNADCDYIEIPVNLKYKFGLPVVGQFVSPYIFTGPSFAFRTSKKAVEDFYCAKKSDIAWNFGFGVEVIKHLQVSASYGLGMTKAYKVVSPNHPEAGIEGKNRYWTITAAWLF